MVAADTSSLVRYLAGAFTGDAEKIDKALTDRSLAIPPPVISELLAAPQRSEVDLAPFLRIPRLRLLDGYWERAARNRRRLIAAGFRAPTLDSLIAQCCIDAEAPLITHDPDFRHFARHCGLKLA